MFDIKIALYGISLLSAIAIPDIFKNLPEIFILLLILMLFDIITGFLQAVKHKKISTKKMYSGGIKKITILIIITISFFIDKYLITNNEQYIFNSSIIYYSMLELISITKNAQKLGIKIPKAITQLIEYNMKGEE